MTSDARRATPASRSRDASTSVVRPQSEAWLRLGGATRPSSRTARAAGLAFIVDIELKSLRPSLRDHADSSMRARERSLGEKGGVTQSGNCLARHGRVWCASLAVRLSRAPASALRLAVLIRRCSRSLARSSVRSTAAAAATGRISSCTVRSIPPARGTLDRHASYTLE